MAADRPWRAIDGGVEVRVRLTPKSSKDAIDGLTETADGPAFKARVRAVPEDGKANAAAEMLVAAFLGVRKSTVALTGGGKSRVKTLAVAGDAVHLSASLTRRQAELATGADDHD